MIKTNLARLNTAQIKDTFSTSVRILKLIWNIDRKLFIASLFGILIPAIVPFINIYIYKLIIDMVVSIASGNASFDTAKLYPLIAARVITYFAQDAAFRTQSLVERLLWTKVPIHLNQIFFKKLSSLDVHYFENDKFRDTLEKARESYGHRPQQLVENLFFSLQSLVQFLIAFVALASLNWFFIILIVLVAIPEFINQTMRSKLAWGIWDAHSPFAKRYRYLTHLLEGPREFKEVKLFKLAGVLLKEVKSIQEKFYIQNKGLAQKDYQYGLMFNVLSTAVFIGIEVFVIFEALAKRVTIGDINFYTGVVGNFQNGLGGLLRNVNAVFESSLYVKNIFEILDIEPIVKQSENPIKLRLRKAPRIEFKDVDFSYPDSDSKILKNFSLTIKPGEKIAFVGENGAGKSTIIKLLARFYDVNSGEILINGINIKDIDILNWYQNLGVLLQDFNKYEHTVKENIYFGNVEKEMRLKDIINASILSGAHPMVSGFKKEYEQILGKMFEGGIELSGGGWQKIALARAFFRSAPILVLDEPTASIDAKSESEIFNRVEKLSKEKTVIIISHRFSTVRNADKIYVIDSGRIVESGTHTELIKLDKQYATLFKLQAKGYQ